MYSKVSSTCPMPSSESLANNSHKKKAIIYDGVGICFKTGDPRNAPLITPEDMTDESTLLALAHRTKPRSPL